ncbi:hypothetical protein [Desulfobacter latus]|nr:hypothetical protein [Desulfobacter latus]
MSIFVVIKSNGSSYVNDFMDQTRLKKVYIQGDAPSRMLPEDTA